MTNDKDFIDLTPTWETAFMISITAWKNTGDSKCLEEPLRAMRILDKIIRDKKEAES